MAAPEGIGLGDLITRVATEIRQARDAAPKNDPVLALTDCELELTVTMTAEGSAGIKVWLLDISGGGSVERASKITLKFGPAPGGAPQVFMVDSKGKLINFPKTKRPAPRDD